MGKRDPRVDAYITKSADFAKPILTHFRDLVHAACPDAEERMKWGSPFFDYKGEMMANMAAFKEHCGIGFWKGSLVVGKESRKDESAGLMGRITKVSDLPSRKILTGYIKKAMELNDAGVKAVRVKGAPKKTLPTPPEFARALKADKAAGKAFEEFSPSARREYVKWFLEAKTEETRARRVGTAVVWIAEGKTRNWKYQK